MSDETGIGKRHIDAAEYSRRVLDAAVELYPEVDDQALELSLGLIRVGNRIANDLESEVHRPSGVSFAGYSVLFAIRAIGTAFPNELARLANVSTASMSSLLNTLQRDGLIVRRPDTDDRRRTIVELTENGERLLEKLFAANNRREVHWVSELSSGERMLLSEMLRKLLRHHPDASAPDSGTVSSA